jgi:hypothetical protein
LLFMSSPSPISVNNDIENFLQGLFDQMPAALGPSRPTTIVFRTSNAFKSFSWLVPMDIMILGVTKAGGSSGNLLVATIQLSSALVSQFAAGSTLQDQIIYADQIQSTVSDTATALLAKRFIPANTTIYLWHETTADGSVILFYEPRLTRASDPRGPTVA